MAATAIANRAPDTELVLPELAWRQNFGGGAVSVSWAACLKYMPDPLIQVETQPENHNPGMRSRANGLPGINVMMVTPGEAAAVRRSLAGQPLRDVPSILESYASEGQIDMIMAPRIGAQNDLEQQAKFLLRFVHEDYPEEVKKFLIENGTPGFRHLMSQILVDSVRYSLKEIYPVYAAAYPHPMSLGRTSLQATSSRFGDYIGKSLEAIFFNDFNPRSAGTREPSL